MAQTRDHDVCYQFPRKFSQADRHAAADSSTIIRLLNAHNAPRGRVDPIGRWSYLGDDSIAIIWHNGYYGPVFKGAQHGDTIEGYVRRTTDHGREPPLEHTRALRVPCPALFTKVLNLQFT